jgi:Clp amino terminal domain, pathogenicity island component
MFERYTEKARRVIIFARYDASQYGSHYIDTEHLLLGLMRENFPLLSNMMGSGISAHAIQQEIEKQTQRGERFSAAAEVPLSVGSNRVLNFAAEEAERLGQRHVGTEHLLSKLLRSLPETAGASEVRDASRPAPAHSFGGNIAAAISRDPSGCYAPFRVERCPLGPPYLCPQAAEKLEASWQQSLVLGINADVVDEHLLGELCAGVGAAGPDSTDRYIHNHEKRMIENPLAADGPLRLG